MVNILKTLKTFWLFILRIWEDVKKVIGYIVSIFQDPTNKTSITRIISIGIISLGAYLILTNIKVVFWAVILIIIGCSVLLIKSFIEKLGKK